MYSQVRGDPLHVTKVKFQTQSCLRDFRQDRQPEIHSTLRREDSQRIYGAHQQRLEISELHFDKFPTPTTFSCWKVSSKTEVCICSQFPTEAEIFAFYGRNSWSRLSVARRENCFSTEQNHPEYPVQEKGQSGGNESSQRRPFPLRKTDCLPDLRILPGHWGQ